MESISLKKKHTLAELRKKRIKDRKKKIATTIIAAVFTSLVFLNVKVETTGKDALFCLFKPGQVSVDHLMEADLTLLKEDVYAMLK